MLKFPFWQRLATDRLGKKSDKHLFLFWFLRYVPDLSRRKQGFDSPLAIYFKNLSFFPKTCLALYPYLQWLAFMQLCR